MKVFLTEKLLGFRTGNLELFTTGAYLPLQASANERKTSSLSPRCSVDQWCIVVVPRFATQLSVTTRPPIGIRAWLDSALVLPDGAPLRWKNVITGERLSARNGQLPISRVLEHFPVALLSPLLNSA